MATITTALTEFADQGNSRTYTVSGHTVQLPRLIIQRRKVPVDQDASGESKISVIRGTVDAAGVPLASKIAIDVSVRYPVKGLAADITAVLALAREVVASDEFAAMVTTQNWVKA